MRSRLLPLVLALVVAGPACSVFQQLTPDPGEQARWGLDPTVRLAEDATAIPILVNEVGCASGRDATGRISDEVEYTQDAVIVTVWVAPPPGEAQACPSNPNTPWIVELSEPLDGRALVNGATTEIAQQPIEFVGDGPGGVDPGDVGGLQITADSEGLGQRAFFLVEALHARAQDPSELEDLGDLSLDPDEVELILGNSGIRRVVDTDVLVDPVAWEFDPANGYEGFAGPFSALISLDGADDLLIGVGEHPHCAGPPRPAPAEYADLTRLWITPNDATSCIEWFTVDLYLDASGTVHAIVIDFFGP